MEKVNFKSKAIDVKNDLPNLVVISCFLTTKQTIICGQTTAIIKDKDSKYYGISKNKNTPNAEMDMTNTSCKSNIGKMINIKNKAKLCLTETVSIPLFSEYMEQNYYMMDGHLAGDSPFDIDSPENGVLIKNEENYYINEISECKNKNFIDINI